MKLNKDLIGKVLNSKVEKISEYRSSENVEIIYAKGEYNPFEVINKYELIHKMKQFALDNGYSLQSNFDTIKGYCNSMPLYWGTRSDGGHGFTISGENEFEAVYNAVDYIIKELNN